MKKILLTVLIALLSVTAKAQKIHFTDTTNLWKQLDEQYNDGFGSYSYGTHSYVGDTTINTIDYKIFDFGPYYSHIVFVREDTLLKKVYVRDKLGDSEVVLMDYNLNVGDTFTIAYSIYSSSFSNKYAVTEIDSTLINTVWHRVWIFSRNLAAWWPAEPIYVIEGIGCINHPTYMLFPGSGAIEPGVYHMYCFSNQGITPSVSPTVSFFNNTTSCTYYPTVYTNELKLQSSKVQLYPNPVLNELTITSTTKITNITISNLVGQTVYTKQYYSDKVVVDLANIAAGVYFIKINNKEVRKFVKL